MKIQNGDGGNNGAVSLRAVAVIAILSITTLVLLADPPSWWASRGVTGGNPPSDYAGVNQGQLKKIATEAYHEMQANLPGGVGDMTAASGTFPGGTGWQLTQLVNTWSSTASGTLVEITGSNTADYAGVNLGQLKHVARLFHERLIEAGFETYYPWDTTGIAPADYAGANIGQVKNLFSFDLTTGTAADGGVPDMWEMNWFGTTGISGTTLAPSGNGLTVYQTFQQGVSPLDYYTGVPPTLTIISGNNQTGAPGAFLADPLVVQVTGTSGSPLVNAPVNFSVTVGSGLLAPDNSGTSATSSSLQVFTGTNGYAQVYFQQPSTGSFTSGIAAFAEGIEADLSQNTSAAISAPSAPTNVTADILPGGSVAVKWSSPSPVDYFSVQYSTDGGSTWITTGTILWNSYVVPASVGITAGSPMRVIATGTGFLSAAGTASSGSIPAILPLPRNYHGTIDISGHNAKRGFDDVNVLSMALADSGTNAGQVTYCFASGILSGTDSFGTSMNGTGQVTVTQWTSGSITSGTINCLASGSGTPITVQPPDNYSGLVDQIINADPSLYLYATGSVSAPSGEFVDSFWIERQYLLPVAPPSVIVQPNGNVYGTVIEPTYSQKSGTTGPGFQLDNAFSGTWAPNTLQPPKVLEFTGTSFTSGTLNLLVGNNTAWTLSFGTYNIGPWGGMVLGANTTGGYFGAGIFGVASGTDYSGYLDYYSDDPYALAEADLLPASYISTPTGTTVFYDAVYDGGELAGILSGSSSGVTATGTAFTPAAMNDNGYAVGGQYYWNGQNLISLGDSTAIGTALNNNNMAIGYDTASGTTGMLWTRNGNSCSAITLQSLIANTPFKGEIQNVIPTAISDADGNNIVSILCSGSVLEGSGTAAVLRPEMLRVQVNNVTPSGTATPPFVSILTYPRNGSASSDTAFSTPKIARGGDVWGVGTISWGSNTSLQKALVSIKAEFKLRADSNIFQGWDSTDRTFKLPWTREPWTAVCMPAAGPGFNNLVKLNLSDMGPAMNLELVVAPGSESYIGITNNTISGTETDFNIVGLAATGLKANGKDNDAQIIVREKDRRDVILATLHVYVLPPQTVHFAIFYCSDGSNVNTALPANLPTPKDISDDINATFNPQTNVTFICDCALPLNVAMKDKNGHDVAGNVFIPSTGELPCDSGTLQQPPQWTTIEDRSQTLHPDPTQYHLWRIFVVKKLQDSYAGALTSPFPNNNFTFINANEIARQYSHEAGRALQVSEDGQTVQFFGEIKGPFDLGPYPLEFRLDGLQRNGQYVVNQEALMSSRQGEYTTWIRHEYWNRSNENTNKAPFK